MKKYKFNIYYFKAAGFHRGLYCGFTYIFLRDIIHNVQKFHITGTYEKVCFHSGIITAEPAGSPARRLFDWLTGSEGARAVDDSGYVPVN